MRVLDLLFFTLQSLGRHRFRSAMMLLSMAIGVASVILLTGLGEGARNYVMDQFSFLGTDTLVLLPGKNETTGGLPPMTGAAARDITLDDLATLQRAVRGIEAVAPLVVGTAPIAYSSRSRETLTIGTTRDFFAIRQLQMAAGMSLPDLELERDQPVAVIGQTIERELFGNERALGQWIRISNRRFRVVGVIEGRGDAFGMNLSDAVVIPVASAQSLFDTQALFRVLIKARANTNVERLSRQLISVMTALHQGEEDVTLIHPDALIGTLNDILLVLTLAISGIAAISLLVAGILIMNITLISVNQRTPEIGLLKAIGAPAGQIRIIFLTEAFALALAGALIGLAAGEALLRIGATLYPMVRFNAPLWAIVSALGVALATGLIFAYLPARRAARMEPVQALTAGAG